MNDCFQNTGYIERQLVATSATVIYSWYSRWYLATGVDAIRFVLKVKNATSANFETQIVIQTALVRPDIPDAPQTLGISKANSVEYALDTSVNSYTAGKMWFRIGVAYDSVSGVTQGDVGIQACWNQLAGIVGTRMVQLQTDNTDDHFAVLTKWFPAIYANKVKVAYNIVGVTGTNLRYKTAMQTAPTSIQQPGAWTALDPSWNTLTATSNYELNSTELSPGTTDMWIRIGIIYNLSAGSSEAAATLAAIVSSRGS